MLVGKFEMAPGVRMTLISSLTILVPSLIIVIQRLIVDFTQGTLGLFIFICCMLSFIVWVMKMRVSNYPDEVKFISADIRRTLRAT